MSAIKQPDNNLDKRNWFYLSIFIITVTLILFMMYNVSMWVQTPFIGVLTTDRLYIMNLDSMEARPWGGFEAGLRQGDKITKIQGVDVGTTGDMYQILRQMNVGDLVDLEYLRAGKTYEVKVSLGKFPNSDILAYIIIPFLVGIFYIGCGLWVYLVRREDQTSRLFYVFASFTGLTFVLITDAFTYNHSALLWHIPLALGVGTLFNFTLAFPIQSIKIANHPWLKYIGPGFAGLIILAYPFFLVASPTALFYKYLFVLDVGAFLLGCGFFLARSVLIWLSSQSLPITKQQARIAFVGSIVGFVFVVVLFGDRLFIQGIRYDPYLFLPLIVFPLSISYASLRYQLYAVEQVVQQGLVYSILSVLSIVGYVLLVSGITILFGTQLSVKQPVWIAVFVTMLALVLLPLRDAIQMRVDRAFSRGKRILEENIRLFNKDLNPSMNLDEIIMLLRQHIKRVLSPSIIHVYVYHWQSDEYLAQPDENGKKTSDLIFSPSSAFVQYLQNVSGYLIAPGDEKLPDELSSEKEKVLLLGADVVYPLKGTNHNVIGWIALGAKTSGAPYTIEDIEFLDALADQVSLAVERAQTVTNMEQRVRELNILMRIAQGINITVDFDDILELIYAQTNRLIPTKDFWIVLYEPRMRAYKYAFYLENDMRLLEMEMLAIQRNKELATVVIENQRLIRARDYRESCLQHGVKPSIQGIYAWVGVPLNAGAETIGAMCLASREPLFEFTDNQVELLSAIADQAAGAIVKAQLLKQTEERAKQLATLSELSKSLTSTLDLEVLLHQVLDSAVEILECEAGTLFLVDEDTGELIFEVVNGPVADELIGKRLPPGTGHAGKAVKTGQTMIVNDARHTTGWDSNLDKQTGFVTRDLLLSPMIVKDRVIGVIEVINKVDMSPFYQEDAELLATFTSHAAIALENARLYTTTDQKLAERVQELSVLQRIDRELNTRLDLDRALNITLEWALSQSRADAGLIGVYRDGNFKVVTVDGFNREELATWDGNNEWLQTAINEHQPCLFSKQSSQPYFFISAQSESQVVVPITREDEVIAMMVLENHSQRSVDDEHLGFLSRLSDHAAVAISNAQLYEDLQEANRAKTEFISLVSHELKNPMTSIRGYTDLLLAGAVGEINDAQKNFLSTIRVNVDRMTTLVSDLADVSRIESGRLKLEFSAVNLREVIDEVVRSQRNQIEEKRQVVDLDAPDDLPLVWGDKNRLIQIMVNLVSNANKYTEEGGKIEISCRVDVGENADKGSKYVRVAVKDNGIGMTEEDKKHIFEKFFRSEDPKAREAPGTGLGLNISRNLVELQGGKIWFESEYRKGTVFYFTVPVYEG